MLRIGPAGWSYKDWNGIVYPVPRPRGFQPLAFLAGLFDTVEINTSFYGPLAAKTVGGWLPQVERNANFRFTAKLWQGFTHARNASNEDAQLVRDGLTPLHDAGRLGALLLQFPWQFRNDPDNRSYLLHLCHRFGEYPLVVEVRHGSWNEPGVLALLEEAGVGLCNIDQPLFKRSLAPGAAVTSGLGYVRLHGRNYQSWWSEQKYYGERYDYLYSLDELEPWTDRIRAVEQAAQDTYVVTNNHYLGKAVANALELVAVLGGRPVNAPASLVEAYPELQELAEAAGGQLSLPIE